MTTYVVIGYVMKWGHPGFRVIYGGQRVYNSNVIHYNPKYSSKGFIKLSRNLFEMNKEILKKKYIDGRKSRNSIQTSCLSIVLGDIEADEKRGVEITEEYINKKLMKLKQSNEQCLTGDNERDQKLHDENKFITSLLPTMLTTSDIVDILGRQFTPNNTNIGEIMRFFKENHAGQYDGRELSATVKNWLSS